MKTHFFYHFPLNLLCHHVFQLTIWYLQKIFMLCFSLKKGKKNEWKCYENIAICSIHQTIVVCVFVLLFSLKHKYLKLFKKKTFMFFYVSYLFIFINSDILSYTKWTKIWIRIGVSLFLSLAEYSFFKKNNNIQK